jgi:hypothetical protein
VNIFVLDNDPVVAAQLQCNKHVVKMILESAQMLSTVHRYLDGSEYVSISKNGRKIKRWTHWTDSINSPIRLYKSVMINHPCTIWSWKSLDNYIWHCNHALALCAEYTHRYGRTHKAQPIIEWCSLNYPYNLYFNGLTEFAQAMPDEYKNGNPVEAYRAYYRGEKSGFAKWTNRDIPEWFLTNDKTMIQCV